MSEKLNRIESILELLLSNRGQRLFSRAKQAGHRGPARILKKEVDVRCSSREAISLAQLIKENGHSQQARSVLRYKE